MKKGHKFGVEQLSCNIYQVKRNNVIDMIQVNRLVDASTEELTLDSVVLNPHSSVLPFSQDNNSTCDFNVSECFSIEIKDTSISHLGNEFLLEPFNNSTGRVNSHIISDISTDIQQEDQPESESISISPFIGDDSLDILSCDASSNRGSSFGGPMDDSILRCNSTGSDSSLSSIPRANSFTTLQSLNSPVDIPVGMFPNHKTSPGLNAASAPLVRVMPRSSHSPPFINPPVNASPIVRSASDSCFHTYTRNQATSNTTMPSAESEYTPISVHPRRTFGTQLLNSLLNQDEVAADPSSFFDMQHGTIRQESTNERGTPSMGIMNVNLLGRDHGMERTERLTPISNRETTAVVSDHAQQRTSPQQDRKQKSDQDLILLPPVHARPPKAFGHFPSRSLSLGPLHLCSICKQRSPEFGRMPKRFTYTELEAATNHFSHDNFIAEGGFGFVYKGILNGQVIAVKQHKMASTQGEMEFCAEVELLSCAQHRNLVMLLGYCDEKGQRMLVYEYVCNRSLDWHLSLNNPNGLNWASRQKIAVGAARGLRYLHEECRVGCIVHRDMRPNNILLTHEFEPMVGDFGLARSQPIGDTSIETQVIGTFGYLAPEYAESGRISWKADVYSFGVVLLELITGRKAIDLSREPGQQSLTEWARPLLTDRKYHELLDPSLDLSYDDYQLCCMVRAASLCIRKDPLTRPRMSQILHILEGEGKETEDSPRHSMESFYMGRTTDILAVQSQPMPFFQSNGSNEARSWKPQSGNSKGRKLKLSYTDML